MDFRSEIKDEDEYVREAIIKYGDVQHSAILDAFGHLCFYDDMKKFAEDRDGSSSLTAKFEWGDNTDTEMWFSVFVNTDRCDDFDNLLYRGSFHKKGLAMEPFITLKMIEERLEAEAEEEEAEENVEAVDKDDSVSPLTVFLAEMVSKLNEQEIETSSPQTPNSCLSSGVAEKDSEDGGDSPQETFQPQIYDYR